MSAERRALMRYVFDLPDLGAMDDALPTARTRRARASRKTVGAVHRRAGGLLAARLRHYTDHGAGVVPELRAVHHYQFYIDEFVRLGRGDDG